MEVKQEVAVLIDGNNIQYGIHELARSSNALINFDTLIEDIVGDRILKRLIFFREGGQISEKLAKKLQDKFHGSVQPCFKSVDVPLAIKATQLASKVDTIIILSGDSDYVELVKHLKSEGVRVEVCAVENSISNHLKIKADRCHYINSDHWFIYNP